MHWTPMVFGSLDLSDDDDDEDNYPDFPTRGYVGVVRVG